jgi:hypothetical protein
VFKGQTPTEEIQIPFYGDLFGPPNMRFPAPLVETTQRQHQWVEYLAFLKRDGQGMFAPTCGDLDAGLSFRVIFTSVDFDVSQLLKKRQGPLIDSGATK